MDPAIEEQAIARCHRMGQVRRSDLKDVTPDAVDISDLTAAKEAATQAENERRIVEMERKRLRMEEAEREGR